MSSVCYSRSSVSVAKRACATVPAQPGLISQTPVPAFPTSCRNIATCKRSVIARADGSPRRAPGYDGRSPSGRQVYEEARLNDMETEYDLPSSRSNGNAQAATRGGAPPYSQSGRPLQPYTGPGRPNSPPSNRPTSRGRGPPSQVPGPDDQLAYQDVPESYALQRAPQAPMQLSFVEALKGKDVISAAEGARLGVAAGAILDASAMTLEAVTLSDTVAPTGRGEPPFCVPTATLTQVGDVILVAEERAMRRPPAVPDFVALLGLHVRTPRGVYIGRVNDVDFEPETGAVTALYYDEYGLTLLPAGLVNLFGIPSDAVLDVTREAVVVDTRFTWLATPGRLEGIGKVLKSLRVVGGERDSAAAVGARQDRSLRDWEAQYGMTAEEWVERYGGDSGTAPVQDPRQMLPRGGSSDPRRRRTPAAGAYAEPRTAPGGDVYGGRAAATPEAAGAPRAPSGAPPQRQRVPPGGPPRRQRGRRAGQAAAVEADWDGDEDGWGPGTQRPAIGDVLQQDGRSYEYDEVQTAPATKRRGDAVRGEDAF
eukprot:jgi/Ulvmu1/656/UM010_0027.1